MYDWADRDDVVEMATSQIGAVELRLIVYYCPTIAPHREPTDPPSVVSASVTARRGRAPPQPQSFNS